MVNELLVALLGTDYPMSICFQPCFYQWFQKEAALRREKKIKYSTDVWTNKVLKKISHCSPGKDHPLACTPFRFHHSPHSSHVYNSWIEKWQERYRTWLAAPVKDPVSGTQLLQELFRQAVGVKAEEKDDIEHGD